MGLTASGAILASSGRNGRVLLTDTASGGVLGSVMAHDRPVIGLSFIEEDATLISAGREGVVSRLWVFFCVSLWVWVCRPLRPWCVGSWIIVDRHLILVVRCVRVCVLGGGVGF